MKRKTTDDIGVFNILLIGKCSGAISIADNIHAKFKDGVLTVEIPRKAPEKPQARSIEIARS